MHELIFAIMLLLAPRATAGAVLVDVPLWRLEGRWVYPPREVGPLGRTAPAVILEFRSNGEFVEHHCWIIEQKDKSLMISGGDPHVVVVGKWESHGNTIRATRLRVSRTVRVIGGEDPLCSRRTLAFTVRTRGVAGDIGEGGMGIYSKVDRLVCPDFEAYVNEARQSNVACGGAV
jgi:hypothetical protein